MRKILLDGDVLLYQVGHQTSEKYDWGDGRWSYVGDVEAGTQKFLGFCDELLEKHPGELIVCFSGNSADCFRKAIDPNYKANRDGNPYKKPPHFQPLKDSLMSSPELKVMFEPTLEADDLLGLLAGPEDLIVTIDKDLHTIPAWHLNLRDIDSESVRWHPAQSFRFFMKQTLMGDSTDNIPGAKGVGPVKADKILDGLAAEEMWPAVVAAYAKSGVEFPEHEALKNARLVRILHPGEFNFETKEVTLWRP